MDNDAYRQQILELEQKLAQETRQRQHLEDLLTATEEKYQHILDAAADAIIAIDEHALVQEFNLGAERIFGYRKAELLGKPLTPIIPQTLRSAHTMGVQRYLETNQPRLPSWQGIEMPGLRKDGREIPLEIAFSTFQSGSTKYLTGVLRDISARKRSEAQLQRAREAAEAATQAKSNFIATVSHELRTPLNAILGFTRIIMRHCQDQLPVKHYQNLEKILASAEHLLELINALLDLSKIEAGHIDLHPGDTALAPLIDDCIRTVEPMLEEKSLVLKTEITPRSLSLITDTDKLKQILINLLGNAVKFTADGTVTITAQRVENLIKIAIADTGDGIPKHSIENIFDAFQQIENDTRQFYQGTGLGLTIARQLSQILGGSIDVTSQRGEGSTFTVALPLTITGDKK